MPEMEPFSFFQTARFSVTDLTRYIKELFDSDELLQEVWVEGEVSNLSRPSSGHLYFTLKDQNASLRCVIWRSTAQRLRTLPRDGALVQAHGSVSVYETGGQYQLYVDQLHPAGEGALF
ncbi:MAG TPA: exodeoxyribonuclease VII large subunit, partial [Anaerolineaceae bacterium]